MAGDRHIALQDRLGCQIGIDMAQWWRPTAANYFDRVSKQVILDALADVGGPELSARFASVKKTDLAMSAERVFAGTYITEAEVRDRAIAWVPEVMRFADPAEIMPAEQDELDAERVTPIGSANDDCPVPREMAA
jgi:ParB family chromosome partitioning protein